MLPLSQTQKTTNKVYVMILVDFNQIVLASLHAALGKHAAGDIEIDPFRNMVANVLRKNNSRFRKQYGPMVLAVDSKS